MSEQVTTKPQSQHWQRLCSRLRYQWWGYLILALVGTLWFIRSLPPREPLMFAILLLIPIISLRQAWKVDRLIAACNARIAEIVPVK